MMSNGSAVINDGGGTEYKIESVSGGYAISGRENGCGWIPVGFQSSLKNSLLAIAFLMDGKQGKEERKREERPRTEGEEKGVRAGRVLIKGGGYREMLSCIADVMKVDVNRLFVTYSGVSYELNIVGGGLVRNFRIEFNKGRNEWSAYRA